jgi:Flp pilus assembly protein TadD
LTAICLLCLSACQTNVERDAALLAEDKSAVAEIKRINTNLSSGQAVSQSDIDALNKLREKYPAAAEVRQALQAALIKRGDWAALEKLIGEIPENEQTSADRITLAKIYFKLGRFQDAVETLKNLPADNATELETKSLLGQAQFYLGRRDEAAQTIDSIWDQILLQKKADEITLRGMIYFHQGNYDKAVETLKKAIEIAPENISASNALSRVYAARGDTANAEIYVTKTQRVNEMTAAAEKKKSRLVPLYYELENAFKSKKYNEVISLAKRLLPETDERNRAALYQYLAVAYQAQGNQIEANNALAEAAKLTGK